MNSIVSLQIGKIKQYENFNSAFIKDIRVKSLDIKENHIVANEIADTKHHGNLEKVVFANSANNYPIWSNFLNKLIKYGYMGENITMQAYNENNVYIGDIHRIGTCVLQVSQPRKPCFKISKIHNNFDFTQAIFKSGKSGWYYRVLEEGVIRQNDDIKIIHKEKTRLSIMELNKLFYNPFLNLSLLDKLEKITTLNERWKKDIQARLNHSYDDSYMFGD